MSASSQLHLSCYVVCLEGETDFAGWRDAARKLVLNGVEPGEIAWNVDGSSGGRCGLPQIPAEAELLVSKEFVERARTVCCHSDPERFALLYSLLWRMRGEPELMKIASDPEVGRFERMEKSIRRDSHKMRAFVRFRKIREAEAERYVAWFEPEHFIVERNAPFFVRRFTGMRWTIITPHKSADWDGALLTIGPGGTKGDAPREDGAEELWRTYFQNIFNPARLKVKAMQSEMPKKYWRNLPEASLI
ncbi:MAG: TIGR03915 family putative DNA repair protein, partial [Pseudaminobacter sp.]|nr:TIGR03915 family putative DNA repair protein [Pseudaminobacter sp.]